MTVTAEELQVLLTLKNKLSEPIQKAVGQIEKAFAGVGSGAASASRDMQSGLEGAAGAVNGFSAAWKHLAQEMAMQREWAKNVRELQKELDNAKAAGQNTTPIMEKLARAMSFEASSSKKIAEIRDEIEGVKQSAEQTEPPLSKLSGVIGMIGGAVTIGAIVKVGTELTKLGAKAEQLRNTFGNLGGSASGLETLRAATRGMVSDMDAMAAANQFMVMGLAENTDEVARLAEMATQLGSAMNHGPKESMESFAAMLANQSIPRLDTFGLSSGRARIRIEELTTGLNALTREQAFTQTVLEQGAEAMARVGEQSEGMAGSLAKIGAQRENVKMLLGEIVSGALEATGVLGLLSEGLAKLTDHLSAFKSAQDSLYDALDAIHALGAEQVLTTEQVRAYESQLNSLSAALQTGKIDNDAYTESIAAMRAEMSEMAAVHEMAGAGLQAELADMRALREETEAAKPAEMLAAAEEAAAQVALWQSHMHDSWFQAANDAADALGSAGDSYVTFTQRTATAMQEWARSSDMSSILGEVAKAYGQHIGDMQKLAEDGIKQREAVTFQHNLAMVQAEAEYQGTRAALEAAGATDAIAKLDAKFQQESAVSSANYAQQQALQARALLAQRITEQQSYITGLQMQSDATRLKLIAMIRGSEAYQALTTADQKQQLDILLVGASEQLKAEITKADQMLQVQKELGEGTINNAMTVAKALISVYQGEIGAGKTALDSLKAQYKATSAAIVRDTQTAFSGIGAGLGAGMLSSASKSLSSAGSAIKAVKKSATAALADVAKDISSGIEAAAKAMEKLPGMLFTPEMEAGLDQMGILLKAAAKRAFAWLQEPDMKTMLKEIEKFSDSILSVFKMLDVNLNKVSPKSGSNFIATMDTWIKQFASAGWRIGQQLMAMAEDARINFELASSVVDWTLKMFEVFSVSFAGIELGAPDIVNRIEAWIKQFASIGWRIGQQLVAMANDARLNFEQAASVVDWTLKMFEIFSVSFAGIELGAPDIVKRIEAWIKQFASVGWRIGKQLEAMANDMRLNFELAASVVEPTLAIFKLFDIDLAKAIQTVTVPEGQRFESLVNERLNQIAVVGSRIFELLKDVDAETRAAVAKAAELAKSYADLFALIGPDLTKAVEVIRGVDLRKAIDARLNQIAIVGGQIYQLLKDVDAETQKSIDHAASISESYAGLFDILGVSLNIEPPPVNFRQRLTVFLDNMAIAVGMLVDGLEEIERDVIGPAAAELKASFAGSLGQILDLLKLGDLFQEMTEVEYSDSVVALVPFRFAVTKIVEDMRWAVGYLVPRLQTLTGEWEEGLESVKSIALLIAEVFGALGDATSAANDMLMEDALNPAALTAALGAYVGAADVLGGFAMAMPGTPGVGAAEVPKLSGTVMLHVVRDDTGEDYVTELELAETVDQILAELWVAA